MAVQTEEVRDLVDFAPEGFLVTSFYLDVDATEFPAPEHIEKSFDSLIHTAESKRKELEDALSHEAEQSLRGDLGKIREFMDGFERHDTNGIAIFSCTAQDLWHVVQLPTRVGNRVEFRPHPVVSPIATFLSHNKATAILLTDKQSARIFTMKEGEVREWTSFEDYVPQRSQAGGWSQMRYQRRSDNWARHHVDHAAELVLRLKQHYPFDWLILGAEVQRQADLESDLHPYLKDAVIGWINVRIDAPAAEVIEEARAVREQAEARLIDRLLDQIQESAGAGGRGTAGLKGTLAALNEQKVHILLVQENFSAPGSECSNCGLLMAAERDTCSACNERAQAVENVVDLAIQRAFELGSTVEVATEQDKLKPIGFIGSVTYY